MDLYKNKKTGKYYVVCMPDTDNLNIAIFYAKKYNDLNINYEILSPDYNKVDSLNLVKDIRKQKLKNINKVRYGD